MQAEHHPSISQKSVIDVQYKCYYNLKTVFHLDGAVTQLSQSISIVGIVAEGPGFARQAGRL